MREAIISALAYDDLFDRPLTLHELLLACPAGAEPADALACLAALEKEGIVAARRGLWCLAGREAIASSRGTRYALAEAKYARVARFVRLARRLPFLRGVAVCNTLARSNARASSDIDLFVVAEPGRVWTCRLFVTGLASLLGVRPTERESRDRICLSFFVAADTLDLRPLAIPGDIYLRRWTREIAPVYEEGAVFERFAAANAWRERARADGVARTLSARRRQPGASLFKRAVESVLSRFGPHLESFSKKLQLRLMPERLKRAATESVGVVLSDAVLKFHDDDRREEIRDAYLKRKSVILSAAKDLPGSDEENRSLGFARDDKSLMAAV